ARMVRSLALVRVREEQHQRRLQPPLAPRRHQELVDHRLGAVDEIAVLRFPDDQPPRLLDVVAVLEADERVLGEWTVVNLERPPRPLPLLERYLRSPGVL